MLNWHDQKSTKTRNFPHKKAERRRRSEKSHPTVKESEETIFTHHKTWYFIHWVSKKTAPRKDEWILPVDDCEWEATLERTERKGKFKWIQFMADTFCNELFRCHPRIWSIYGMAEEGDERKTFCCHKTCGVRWVKQFHEWKSSSPAPRASRIDGEDQESERRYANSITGWWILRHAWLQRRHSEAYTVANLCLNSGFYWNWLFSKLADVDTSTSAKFDFQKGTSFECFQRTFLIFKGAELTGVSYTSLTLGNKRWQSTPLGAQRKRRRRRRHQYLWRQASSVIGKVRSLGKGQNFLSRRENLLSPLSLAVAQPCSIQNFLRRFIGERRGAFCSARHNWKLYRSVQFS